MGKLVWKEMTLEEVEAVQVGDKIRIDGVENKVTYTFNKVTDFGFRTTKVRKYLNTNHDTDIVNTDDVREMKYKFEHLVEETEMNTRLERDQEYDVKLTGEALVWLKFVSDRSCSDLAFSVNSAVCTVLNKFSNEIGDSPRSLTKGIGWDVDYKPFVASWLDEVFKVPETEDQRKLRELEEKHVELGKAIEAMRNK